MTRGAQALAAPQRLTPALERELVLAAQDDDGDARARLIETFTFYLRAGKRLARRVTEIALQLNPVSHLGLGEDGSLGVAPNVLVLALHPGEGLSLSPVAKIPGARLRLRPVRLDLPYRATSTS